MIGSTIGPYRIIEAIGRGGMGVVYRAVDMMLEREVAVKIINRDLTAEPQVVERFRSEAVTLAKLNHPNIATLFSLFPHEGDLLMVMEFLRGESLEGRIRRGGALPLPRALAVICQALEGVNHAHEFGIVHRDLKPSNLMLMANGLVKVMDFGIARALGASHLTKEGHLVGTVGYMSPEQIKGQDADRRSDLYSMGVVLYQSLTGQLPFSGTSEFEIMRAHIEFPPIPPRAFNPDLPRPVEEIVLRALAKSPRERFQSALEFRSALLPILEQSARAAGGALTGDWPRQVLTQPDLCPPPVWPSPPGASGVSDSHGTDDSATSVESPEPDAQWSGSPSLASPSAIPPAPHVLEPPAGTAAPANRIAAEAQPMSQIATGARQSPTNRLSWKHYSAVGLILVLAIVWLFWRTPNEAIRAARPDRPPLVRQNSTLTPVAQSAGSRGILLAAPGRTSSLTDYHGQPTAAPVTPEPSRAPLNEIASAKRASSENARTAAPGQAMLSSAPKRQTEEPPASFDKVKMLVANGPKLEETDVVLELGVKGVTIVAAQGNAQLKAFPYRALKAAIYSFSRDPVTEEGDKRASNFVSTLFGRKKRWLTLETKNDDAVLRLDKNNSDLVIAALESRSQVQVQKVADEK